MKVLITGGAGFIGSHLARELIKRRKDVYVIDDLSTGSLENIKDLFGHKTSYFHQVFNIPAVLMNLR